MQTRRPTTKLLPYTTLFRSRESHLKKFGIRMFFGAPATDFSHQDELGASQTFGIPTYQIDRGEIENHLAARVEARSEEHTSELQSRPHLVCRLLLEKINTVV